MTRRAGDRYLTPADHPYYGYSTGEPCAYCQATEGDHGFVMHNPCCKCRKCPAEPEDTRRAAPGNPRTTRWRLRVWRFRALASARALARMAATLEGAALLASAQRAQVTRLQVALTDARAALQAQREIARELGERADRAEAALLARRPVAQA